MVGMLPGVESARRRRLHQSIIPSDSSSTTTKLRSTRWSSFGLYASNRDSHHSSSSSQQRSTLNQADQDEKLAENAREAKERLNERLRMQRKPDTRRQNKKEEKSLKDSEKQGKDKGKEEVKRERKRFSWGKLRWKGSEQELCAICLEELKPSEALVHLPCTHKFHLKCLVPWFEKKGPCPCCRMPIASSHTSY